MVVSSTNTYTPDKADRDGFQLKCNDTVHSMWNIEDDIVKYLDVKPNCKFILENVALDPNSEVFTLSITSKLNFISNIKVKKYSSHNLTPNITEHHSNSNSNYHKDSNAEKEKFMLLDSINLQPKS